MRRPLPRFLFPHLAACTCLAVLMLTSTARAQSWSEVGDAGDLIATAQTTVGSGPLTVVTGTLPLDADVDLYCISITDVAAFSANIVCLAQADPSIWLFRPDGSGMAMNDLCQFGYKTIPASFVSTPGTYYLAVAPQGASAQSAGGAMWLIGVFTGPRAPDGPGAAGTLVSWSGTPIGSSINYSLSLSGVGYCSAATPAGARTWGSLKTHYR